MWDPLRKSFTPCVSPDMFAELICFGLGSGWKLFELILLWMKKRAISLEVSKLYMLPQDVVADCESELVASRSSPTSYVLYDRYVTGSQKAKASGLQRPPAASSG